MKPDFNMHQMRRESFTPSLRSVNEEQRTIEFVASTEAKDRYGDVIRVEGWDMRAYMKNPVFLWAHNSREMPIGRTVKIAVEKNPPALVQTVKFTDATENPMGDQAFRLYRGGFLSAVSVGFKPTRRPKAMEGDDGEFMGWEFNGQELLELSAVPIPANPEALARGLESGELTQEMVNRFFIKEEKKAGEQSKAEEKVMQPKLQEVIERLVETNNNVNALASAAVNKEQLADILAMQQRMNDAVVEAFKKMADGSAQQESVSALATKLDGLGKSLEGILSSVATGKSVDALPPKLEEIRVISSKSLANAVNKVDLEDMSARVDGVRTEVTNRMDVLIKHGAREVTVLGIADSMEAIRIQLTSLVETMAVQSASMAEIVSCLASLAKEPAPINNTVIIEQPEPTKAIAPVEEKKPDSKPDPLSAMFLKPNGKQVSRDSGTPQLTSANSAGR